MACGWTGTGSLVGCPACGSPEVAAVRAGALVTIPAGAAPCMACGSLERLLVFRGTSRVAALIWLIRERRVSGYWCERCARKKTAASLAYTGLVGWWGVFGAFFWAPRATYHNWRAVWSPPRRPLTWGAESVSDFAAELAEARAGRDEAWSGFDRPPAATETSP